MQVKHFNYFTKNKFAGQTVKVVLKGRWSPVACFDKAYKVDADQIQSDPNKDRVEFKVLNTGHTVIGQISQILKISEWT